MNVRLRKRLILYQYLAGFCDSATGLLLVCFPIVTLSFIGISIFPVPAFIRFIGVFVLSVGITYLWVAILWPLNEPAVLVWLTQWKITAFIRLMVALFLFWQLLSRGLEPRWIVVAVTDSIFAAIQIIGLEQGWVERAC
jgi:hypothetical protein